MSNIVRTVHNRENPYVQLNKKALWDPDLSLEAVGLWARLMSRPDDWEVSAEELSKSCKCSKKKIYKYLRQLVAAGYAFRYQPKIASSKNKKKVFGDIETYVFEFKVTEEQIKEMFPLAHFGHAQSELSSNGTATNIDLTNPSSLRSEEREEKKAKDPSAEAEDVCKFFLENLKERNPHLQPNLKKWALEIDCMLRIDKRDVSLTKKLIVWASTHKFWKTACVSPQKLRAKWDEMFIQMQGNQENTLHEERIRNNKSYVYEIKKKFPEKLRDLSFDLKYAYNKAKAKEVAFDMPEERFDELFKNMFMGT